MTESDPTLAQLQQVVWLRDRNSAAVLQELADRGMVIPRFVVQSGVFDTSKTCRDVSIGFSSRIG